MHVEVEIQFNLNQISSFLTFASFLGQIAGKSQSFKPRGHVTTNLRSGRVKAIIICCTFLSTTKITPQVAVDGETTLTWSGDRMIIDVKSVGLQMKSITGACILPVLLWFAYFNLGIHKLGENFKIT